MSDDKALALILAAAVCGIMLAIARALDKMRTRTLIALWFVLATIFTAIWRFGLL